MNDFSPSQGNQGQSGDADTQALPSIELYNRHMRHIADDATDALVAANDSNPVLFQHKLNVYRKKPGVYDLGESYALATDADFMSLIARAADFYTTEPVRRPRPALPPSWLPGQLRIELIERHHCLPPVPDGAEVDDHAPVSYGGYGDIDPDEEEAEL